MRDDDAMGVRVAFMGALGVNGGEYMKSCIGFWALRCGVSLFFGTIRYVFTFVGVAGKRWCGAV